MKSFDTFGDLIKYIRYCPICKDTRVVHYSLISEGAIFEDTISLLENNDVVLSFTYPRIKSPYMYLRLFANNKLDYSHQDGFYIKEFLEKTPPIEVSFFVECAQLCSFLNTCDIKLDFTNKLMSDFTIDTEEIMFDYNDVEYRLYFEHNNWKYFKIETRIFNKENEQVETHTASLPIDIELDFSNKKELAKTLKTFILLA